MSDGLAPRPSLATAAFQRALLAASHLNTQRARPSHRRTSKEGLVVHTPVDRRPASGRVLKYSLRPSWAAGRSLVGGSALRGATLTGSSDHVAWRRQLEDGLTGPSESDARKPCMGSITNVRWQTTRPSSSASCTSSSTATASTATATSCQAACAPSWWIHHAGVVRAAAAALHDAPRCAPR